MLIDGALVGASTAKVFETVNPATEEVLGVVADASDEDAERALAAARRAFDATTWSTDVALRVRCLRQLQAAMRTHAEELRAMTIAETGSPLFMTRSAQLDDPGGVFGVGGRSRRVLRVGDRSWQGGAFGDARATLDLSRARRRGGRHHAVERSPPDQPGQAGTGPRCGQHRHPQARSRYAVVRHGARSSHRRGDRHPRRRRQHPAFVGPRLRGATGRRRPGRPGELHGLDGHGSHGDGPGRGHPQARVPRARWEVCVRGARRR